MWAGKLLSFVLGPSGKWIIGVLLLTAWTLYQRADATSDCKEEQFRVELEAANRKLRDAEALSRRADDRAQKSAEALEEAERQQDELLQKLQSTNEFCPLSDDAIERLRAIR